MATFSRRAALPLAASLTVFAGAALAQLVVGDDDGPREKAVASDMKAAPVGVDRPKPTFMLSERDKRVHGLKPFQVLVDAAAPGATLRPAPGTYAGPVTIDKPLTIEGDGVTIDAGDRGTVMLVHAEGVTLRGLHLTGSGDSHDTDDSCLDVRGSRNVFENLVIDNCLFGIDLKQSNRNALRGNRITSKPRDLGVRGDGLRIWYSNDNLIEGNQVTDSRDMVAWYSNRNTFRGNVGRRSRYSIHFMFADGNVVEGNRFYDNSVGVYFMYTNGGVARNNVVSHATGAAGMAFGFKESSNVLIENNEIIYCAIGVGSDLSPFEPNAAIEFRNNRFAYNGMAMSFNSETGGNRIVGNVFEGNLTQVGYGAHSEAAAKNFWQGNYWDDYQGFDRDGDGIGDRPHELLSYADQIWMEMPVARFFRNSPVMELLDFLERLAPFSTPAKVLQDDKPRFSRERVSS
ncbi:MAG TPA: nitrous oxide reductase family maturation protein NosD [Rhodocyclaceae bacterium]|nr:nitrous oxide reductase family maturation protein NosD [Rhodocyclaceae bacterium]HMV54477.1 nitrous oxide reductase family maturation protein NosD [Rhodocyclaceae bacterium]HNA02873.1 nitrous oxide reductase family maturation protein NosD [Rhodocyclaceae bacterium]HNB77919.1 nitrous oxide reductase family maturation protein NosD [Rhodocyclaceae bacterium]HNC60132.1 nitrous oxide reductase family maturation protein NosD [Rhodocyclaceae bacterium]